MRKNIDLLKTVDNLVSTAVTKVQTILNDPKAKETSVLNAADKIIKLRFALQESVRKEAMDKIDMEYKQLNLEEKRIKVELLRTGQFPTGDGKGNDDKPNGEYSRSFTPAMKPDDVNDAILETG